MVSAPQGSPPLVSAPDAVDKAEMPLIVTLPLHLLQSMIGLFFFNYSSSSTAVDHSPKAKCPRLAWLFSLPDCYPTLVVVATAFSLYTAHVPNGDTIWEIKTLIHLIAGLLALAIAFHYCWRWARYEVRSLIDPIPLPNGPWTLPILGSLAAINKTEPQKSILDWRGTFGPVFTISLPVPTVVICGIQEIRLAAMMCETTGRPVSYLYLIFMRDRVEGNGLILSSGRTWTMAKTFANMHMRRSGVTTDEFIRLAEDFGQRMTAQIEVELDTKGPILDLHAILSYPVAAIICQIVLGRTYEYGNSRMSDLKKRLDDVLASVQSISMLVADNNSWLENRLPADIEYRRQGFHLQDFFIEELHHNEWAMDMGNAFDGRDKNGEDLDLDNVLFRALQNPEDLEHGTIDAVLLAGDLWTGGMETTLTALRWGIIYLMAHPSVQEKLHEEVFARYPRDSGRFEWSSRRTDLPYLCAVTDEILRLANILPWNIPHRATETFTIGDKMIKRGTNLMFAYSAIHHDESLFPDPYAFNPERFLRRRKPTEEEAAKWSEAGKGIKDFIEYVKDENLNPFGMGLRGCPGELLARKELFVFLIVLSQRYRFSADESRPPCMERPMGMTSAPANYLCRVERREDWYGDLE